MEQLQLVNQAVEFLTRHIPRDFKPTLGLTLGTGLSDLSNKIEALTTIPYSEIPGFPVSTVQSHKGELVLGRLAGKDIAALAGRFHLYEGYSPQQITFPVRVLARFGVSSFIFSNAAGGLNLDMRAGKVMLVTDHINFSGKNPLVGPNVDEWGERFPDMSQVYDPGLMDLARKAAKDAGITMYEGVYISLLGPSLETPAETRMLGRLGADAVGMSTVLEAIVAKHHGLKILAFSAISNVNDPDDMQPAPIELILENAEQAGEDLGRIIEGVAAAM